MMRLQGKRIAIVEDDGVLALSLRDSLEGAGAEVVYEANDIQGALAAAAMDRVDAAVLDINLRGHACYPAAAVFQRHGVAVVFASANEPTAVPAGFHASPFLRKPYDKTALVEAILEATTTFDRAGS